MSETMRIRAAVLREVGAAVPYSQSRPLGIETLELAPPGAGEVLVRITAAGLCHSDLSAINGDRLRPMPIALGHEAAGIVASLGEGVTDLAVGDQVVMVFMPSCGHCLPCAEGRPALCEPGAAANTTGVLLGGTRRLTCQGIAVHHYLGCSAFADHAVVSRRSLVRVARDLKPEHAALFGCAVLTGVGAVVNTARLQPGMRAAVVGLGGVGLAAVLGANAAGAGEVVAVDLSEERLGLARSLGATRTALASDPDAVASIRAQTEGGVDVAFEMAGSVKALELAFAITRRGGTTITAGLPAPDARLALPVTMLVAEERSVRGSYIGSAVPSRDIPRYVGLFRAGRLPVDRLLTGTLPLEQINEGFDRLRTGEAVRQVVLF